jgi:putative flavoprotein involved in K+ transport
VTRTDTIVIGAGQAGLATSACLTDLAHDHVVLERGAVAERWRSERWDSLRLLTPNWMTRLPGWTYRGPEPDGFMTASDFADHLTRYAASFTAPVVGDSPVRSVERAPGGFRVVTGRDEWLAGNVVVATGFADRPAVPSFAPELGSDVEQVTPDRYRNPEQLADGGVLVVGASATGVQLATELRRSGRPVHLAVGSHTRIPRRYRGADIWWWFDRFGIVDDRVDGRDPAQIRSEPSSQLSGANGGETIGLASLASLGVTMSGRLVAVEGSRVRFGDNLADAAAAADARLARLLDRIDRGIETEGVLAPPAERFAPTSATVGASELDLRAAGIRTVVWATGHRRDYRWLHVPVLDRSGELVHTYGATPVPGLYAVGLRWQTRRSSHFIDGVRHDARMVAGAVARRSRLRTISAEAS